MTSPVSVDIFVEDRAHEDFLKPLLTRVAEDEKAQVKVRVRSARGGHGRAIDEFKVYQTIVERGTGQSSYPDLLIVGIDGNCTTLAKKRSEIRNTTRAAFTDRLVIACPDPHVECWYLADPESFQSVVGHRPRVGKKKCVRDHYKNLLASAVRQAGHPPTLGGIEFAQELVASMDFYRAGRNDRSLKKFIGELQAKLRVLKRL